MDSHDEDTPQVDDPDSHRDRQTRRAEKPPSSGFGSLARTYRDVGPYLGLGIQLAATIVICFFIGRWLDQVLNTTPWLMVLGAFIGAAAGLYNFIRIVIELDKKQKEKQTLGKKTKE